MPRKPALDECEMRKCRRRGYPTEVVYKNDVTRVEMLCDRHMRSRVHQVDVVSVKRLVA